MSDVNSENCPDEPKEEIYYYLHWNYVFDVRQANKIVRDGREPVEVEEKSVRVAVETVDLITEHIANVNPELPGIIAHVKYKTNDGETLKGHSLIDGNHRAARCLEIGKPFFAYILSEEESEKILIRRPECGQLDFAMLPDSVKGAASIEKSST